MANNEIPTLEEQAAAVMRLSENSQGIGDPSIRAFIGRIEKRISELREQGQEKQGRQGERPSGLKDGDEIIFTLSGSNEDKKLE